MQDLFSFSTRDLSAKNGAFGANGDTNETTHPWKLSRTGQRDKLRTISIGVAVQRCRLLFR